MSITIYFNITKLTKFFYEYKVEKSLKCEISVQARAEMFVLVVLLTVRTKWMLKFCCLLTLNKLEGEWNPSGKRFNQCKLSYAL